MIKWSDQREIPKPQIKRHRNCYRRQQNKKKDNKKQNLENCVYNIKTPENTNVVENELNSANIQKRK